MTSEPSSPLNRTPDGATGVLLWGRIFACTLILFLFALLMVACTIGIEPQQVIDAGEPRYISNCARCHQVDGGGVAGIFPALAGNPVVTLHDPAPMIDVIVNGRGSMPPFRGALDSEELASVASYIRNSWGNQGSIVMERQVQSN